MYYSDALHGSEQLLGSSAFKLRSTGDNSQDSSYPCLQGEPGPSAKGLMGFLSWWQQLLGATQEAKTQGCPEETQSESRDVKRPSGHVKGTAS